MTDLFNADEEFDTAVADVLAQEFDHDLVVEIYPQFTEYSVNSNPLTTARLVNDDGTIHIYIFTEQGVSADAEFNNMTPAVIATVISSYLRQN